MSSEQLNNAAPKVGDHNRRIKMISLYRNRVLRMMKSHTGWPFDYVLAVDLDMSPWEVSQYLRFHASMPPAQLSKGLLLRRFKGGKKERKRDGGGARASLPGTVPTISP